MKEKQVAKLIHDFLEPQAKICSICGGSGKTKLINPPETIPCDACDGTGIQPQAKEPCPNCGGSGLWIYQGDGWQGSTGDKCLTCNGTGKGAREDENRKGL